MRVQERFQGYEVANQGARSRKSQKPVVQKRVDGSQGLAGHVPLIGRNEDFCNRTSGRCVVPPWTVCQVVYASHLAPPQFSRCPCPPRLETFPIRWIIPRRRPKKKKKIDPKNDPDQIGNRNVAKGPNFFTIPQEIALGKSLADQVERQSKIIDDPVIAEYVNRVGQNLVRNSDAKFPFIIKVIDVDDVNAFALPGGFFFVNSGLILSADSEAELAGVMAHEIAHVAARHITRQITKSQLAQIMTTPLVFFPGWGGFGARQAAGAALPLSFMHFSQADESNADLLGLQYMYKTGYDPGAFVDFFEKIEALERTKPNTLSQFFSSHPPTANRIAKSQKNIQSLLKDRPEYVVTTTEFDAVKARLQALHNRGRWTRRIRMGRRAKTNGPR